MAQNVSKVPTKERNNHPQGRSGSGTPTKKGPATGSKLGNKGKGRSAFTKNKPSGS